MPSCMTRWNEIHGANRCWSIPANGMSSKYDAQSANVRMNWNVSATTSMPLIVLSLTAMATFTNASPHTMIVNAPSRSTRCSSSSGGKSTRRIERQAAGAIITAMPIAVPMMRPFSGNAADATKQIAATPWMTARWRGERRVRAVCTRSAPVHERDRRHQRGVGAEQQHLVVPHARARFHCDDGDQDHLQQHQAAVDDVGHVEAIGEHRRRQPHPPDRGRTLQRPTRCVTRRAGATPQS